MCYKFTFSQREPKVSAWMDMDIKWQMLVLLKDTHKYRRRLIYVVGGGMYLQSSKNGNN